MATIYCYDVHGSAVPVAPEVLNFRPAVYGIFIEDDQVLLLRHPQTGLWHPPGSILEAHETPVQAVKYYFRQVINVTPVVGPLLFVEDQYRIDSNGQAWQLSVLYYALDRPPLTAVFIGNLANSTQWIPLAELRREQMQFGYEAVQAGRLRLKL